MKGIRIITVLLVCSSLVAIAAADPVMTVSEQPTGIAIGDTFTAEVTVDPVGGEIYAAQYDLGFDHTILKATEPMQGNFLSQGDAETYLGVNTINNTVGKIQYAETRVGDPEMVGGATATGVLASINFEMIGEGVSTLTLSNVLYDIIDPESTSEPTSDNGDDENLDNRYISLATPAATLTAAPTEAPTTSAQPSGDDSGAVEDHGTTRVSSETGSVVAESIPPAAEAAPAASPTETPLRPESATPGFAALSAIMGLLVVAIMLKSRRGE